VKGDGVELHDGGRVRRLTSSEIEAIEVRRTARGRAQLSLKHEGRLWRLPLDREDLAWTRMLIGGSVVVASGGGPGAPVESGPPPIAAQERAYAEFLAAQRMAVSSPKGILFLASAVAFAASMLISTSWQWLAVIMPVLFVHELGHWAAMRAFGHRDARISFIPFLGAATTTKDPFQKPWQEVVMLLAGPVPGIVLGTALLLLSPIPHVDPATVRMLAIMAIVVNAGNLLPFHPLDGGRIVHALVTAGRPRIDLAFKSIATLAFVAGALAAKDFVLGSIAVIGALGWRSTFRLARLEERIRRTPGFDPRLPIEERRGYVFRTLAEEPSGQARQWGATVAALDMPLGYRRSPLWRLVAFVLAFVALLAGGLWAKKRFMAKFERMRCPSSEGATPLSCAGSPNLTYGDVTWKHGRARTPPPRTEDSEFPRRFPIGAFVWCRADDDQDGTLASLEHDLRQAVAGAPLCAALPWEELPPEPAGSAGIRFGGRGTLTALRYALHLQGSRGLAYLDERVKAMQTPPDAEVVRLLREVVAAPRGSAKAREARNQLAERIGRSPTESCERIAIANVSRSSPIDDTPEGANEKSPPVAPSHAPSGERWVRFSVGLATPADFAPVAAYLCNAGCRVEVLPLEPDDDRVQACF
jgi:Zn-dependent protease